MDKRERLEKTVAGEPTDRVPVALWRHFPGDDQRSADLARSVVDFQKAYDWDFCKITPASSYAISDYGTQDVWEGNPEGTRRYTRHSIQRTLDWASLRPLDPSKGALARALEATRMVTDELGDSVPALMTIFNPLSQAKNMAGGEALIRHLRTEPERLRSGLNTLTENILRFFDALRKLPVAGIFYAIQHASYSKLSEAEYAAFGLPFDRKILESVPAHWWLNMVHLHGEAPMFKLVADLPAQAVNWHDRETEPDIAEGKSLLRGAACGGLSRWDDVHQGTPTTIRDAARAAMQKTNNRRFILSTGCVVMITTPLSSLRAVREAVEPA